ncbi:uncharacterized protein BJ171DRAFT_554537, partial [Polychytrium aggregatum]|uniref:uncharacterized protein n=1 Tax=Polychytrium aggregatum TaxID=110093 RepID=UPI0022FE2E9A
MVSPFMPNGTLRDYVANNNISLEEKLSLLYQVASALAYLHARRIIHGDLKAANILLDKSFQAIVTDFGLSRTKHTSASMNHNRNGGSTGGTEGYMAPEMLDDENPSGTTIKTDVYAFAITMYEALTNASPVWISVDGQALRSRAIERLVEKGKRPKRLDGIPGDIWSLIEACWHQDPAMRPAFKDIVLSLSDYKDIHPQTLGAARSPSDLALSTRLQDLSVSPAPTPHSDRPQPSSQQHTADSSLSSESQTLAQRLGNLGIPRAVVMSIRRGDAESHLTAARMVSDGKAANDPAWTTAAELYQAAADSGNLEAAFQLGWLHFAGIGITKSDTEAFAYWQLVHNQSSDAIMKPIATFMMGWCYYLGRGTQQDEPQANQFFLKSKTPEFPFGQAFIHGDGKIELSSPIAAKFFRLCQFGAEDDWFCRHLVARCMLGGFGTKKDQELAVGILHELANQGYSISQYVLADCYLEGFGVPQDHIMSVEWYRRSAEGSDVNAIRSLGLQYLEGQGVPQDHAKAIVLLTKAANTGHVLGQVNLGSCYYNGQGVAQDYAKAVEWYTKAANQGNANAQFMLGICYRDGNGATQDHVKAVEWFIKAAIQGNASAQNQLGHCYFSGQGVTQDYARAVEWFTKAANQGSTNAQFSLGVRYYKGDGATQNYAKAVEWFTKAANQGNASAQDWLGDCYYNGNGVTEDHAKAVEWYTKAANQGNANAQFGLGIRYYKGEGVTQNYVKAVEWFTKAANQGYANAQDWLGDCYYNGNGVTEDYAKAVEWYTKAANQGNANAQLSLGIRYCKGEGVIQNYAKAVEWYTKAANQGNAGA